MVIASFAKSLPHSARGAHLSLSLQNQAAIVRFHNSEWRGKRLKVECVRDDDHTTARVPETLVAYVSGRVKTTRSSGSSSGEKSTHAVRRITRDDVKRLSRGQPSKRRGFGSRNVPHRLNEEEQAELDRAARKGYLSLLGGGNRRSRRGSPLTNIHRQWCDAREQPQILLYKAVSGGGGQAAAVLDEVVVDFSPLRLRGLLDDATLVEEEYMVRWKAQLLTAASDAGMALRDESNHDADGVEECGPLDSINDDCGDGDDVDATTAYTITIEALDQQAWATSPIWKLSVVSLGIFVGERSRAKLMASSLAKVWDIPEIVEAEAGADRRGPKTRRAAGARHGGHTKVKGLTEHRRRGGGNRQAW